MLDRFSVTANTPMIEIRDLLFYYQVVDAILRHLAKAEARSPRGPPGAAALPAAS
jgi:hypothetical protein